MSDIRIYQALTFVLLVAAFVVILLAIGEFKTVGVPHPPTTHTPTTHTGE